MVEETFELTLLFDYYGDLLTQKQKNLIFRTSYPNRKRMCLFRKIERK